MKIFHIRNKPSKKERALADSLVLVVFMVFAIFLLVASTSTDSNKIGVSGRAVMEIGDESVANHTKILFDADAEFETENEVPVIVVMKDRFKEQQRSVQNDLQEEKKSYERLSKRQQRLQEQNILAAEQRLNNIQKLREDDIQDVQNKVLNKLDSKEFKEKDRADRISAVSGRITKEGLEKLNEDPQVEYVFYDVPLQITLDYSVPAIDANYTREVLGFSGEGIKVAVLDSGIDYTHNDFGDCSQAQFLAGTCGKIIGGYDYVNYDNDPMDDNSHGTHVAGIIGANGTVYKGVAPDALFYAIKVCNSGGSCPSSSILQGIDWAIAHDADIIHMSLGGLSIPTYPYVDPTAIFSDDAVDYGKVVVVSAGNSGPGTNIISTPSTGRDVITVAASDDKNTIDVSDDTIASFSCRGPSAFGRFDPDVSAPGYSIYSTVPGDTYAYKSGTSMSAPHVSGAVALMMEADSSLQPLDYRLRLMNTASNISGHEFEKGAGIINVTRAITYNTSVSVNNDDRAEIEILPGNYLDISLQFENDADFSVTFVPLVEAISDIEMDRYLDESVFDLPEDLMVGASGSEINTFRINMPSDALPGIYGTTLVLVGDNGEFLRMPFAITVPFVGDGVINGTMDDNGIGTSPEGDYIYYKIITNNGTNMHLALNWDTSNSAYIYVYAETGALIASNTSGAKPSLLDIETTLNEYWIAVRDVDISGNVNYNVTITYGGNLTVNPQSWQGSVSSGSEQNITFNLYNDPNAKSALGFEVYGESKGNSFTKSDTVTKANNDTWYFSSEGINTDYVKLCYANLTWSDYNTDLDLDILYLQNSVLYGTDYSSGHWNDVNTKSTEYLQWVDLEYYGKTYDDVAVYVSSYSGASTSYNLIVNCTYVEPMSNVIVSPAYLGSLGSGAVQDVNVSIPGGTLGTNSTYRFYLNVNDSEFIYASIPIDISVSDVLAYTNFDGSTTDFNNVEDLSNVVNATIEKVSSGKIKWFGNVDARDVNFNELVTIGSNYIFVNSSEMDYSFNSSAELTLYGLTFNDPYIEVNNGSGWGNCTECNISSYTGGTLIFNTTHFTEYRAAESSNCAFPIDGDWLIDSETAICDNEHIVVNGNVFVNGTGVLVIDDSNFTVNSSTPGEFAVYVEDTGNLTVLYSKIFNESSTFDIFFNNTSNGYFNYVEIGNATGIAVYDYSNTTFVHTNISHNSWFDDDSVNYFDNVFISNRQHDDSAFSVQFQGSSTNDLRNSVLDSIVYFDFDSYNTFSGVNLTNNTFMRRNSTCLFDGPASNITYMDTIFNIPSEKGILINGTVDMPEVYPGTFVATSRIHRAYPVYVTNQFSLPYPNAYVNVTNATGDAVFEGYTDSSGFIEANYTFTSVDYNLDFNISTNETKNFTLIRDTPIFLIKNDDPPQYSNNITDPFPATYAPGLGYQFNITFTDDVAITDVFLEFDGINYTLLNSQVQQNGNEYYYTFTDLAAGTHSYRWYANDTINQFNSTDALTYTINQATALCFLSFDPETSVGYKEGVNASCYCDNLEIPALLYRNDTDVNATENYVNYTNIGGGNWNYTCNASATTNYTFAENTTIYTITQANNVTEILHLYLNAVENNVSVVFPNTVIGTSNSYGFDTDLYVNENVVSGGVNPGYTASGVGLYNFTLHLNATQNYTSAYITWFGNITPDEAPQYFNNLTYPFPATYAPGQTYQFNATWTDDYGLSDVILEFDGINYTFLNSQILQNGNEFYYTFTDLEAGSHSYRWYANDSLNQLNSTGALSYDIAQATGECYLVFDPMPNVSYKAGLNASCSCTNTDVTALLYRNDTDVTSTENNINYTNIAAGTWNYTCNSTATTNYTFAENSSLYNVTQATNLSEILHLYLNAVENNVSVVFPNTVIGTSDSAGFDVDLYVDEIVRSGGINPVYTASGVGLHNFTLVINDTQNYTADYITWFGNITPDFEPYYSNNISYPFPATYSPGQIYQFNATWQDDYGLSDVILEFNGTNYTYLNSQLLQNGNEFYYTFNDLEAGTYIYRWYANDTLNQLNSTDALTYDISQATGECYLIFDPMPNTTYKEGINASCSCLGASELLYRNSTDVTSTENNINYTNIGGGNWNYTCNTTETTNYTFAENTSIYNVSQATNLTEVLHLYLNGIQNNVTVGFPATITGTSDTYGFDGDLYVDEVVEDGGINPTYLVSAIGEYNFTLLVNETQNYTSASITWWGNITSDEPPQYSNNLTDPFPATYSPGQVYQFNITWTDDNGLSDVILEFDGVNYTLLNSQVLQNGNEFYYTFTDLDAGSYIYRWYANDTINQLNSTDSLTYVIQQASSECFLNVSPNGGVTYKEGVNASCYCTSNDLDALLYRNSTDVSFTENDVNYTNIGGGNWNYTCNVTATTNYTFAENTTIYDVNPATNLSEVIHLYLNSVENNVSVIYPDTVIGTSDSFGIDADLYVNEVVRGGGINPGYTADGFGYYNFTLWLNDTQNYTAASITWWGNITQNQTICYLTFDPEPSTVYQEGVNVTCACNNAEEAALLYRNDTDVNLTENQINYTNLAAGLWEYTCNVSDTGNFSLGYNATNYSIARANGEVSLLLNDTDANYSINITEFVNITADMINPSSADIAISQDNVIINSGASPLENISQYNATGSYNITATYSGDQNYTSAYETHFIDVDDPVPVVIASDSPDPVDQDNIINITATVTDNNLESVLISVNDSANVTMNNSSSILFFHQDFNTSITGAYPYVIFTNDTSGQSVKAIGTFTVQVAGTGGSPGSGSPGGGGSSSRTCVENWNCTDWGKCGIFGRQIRRCEDINGCGTTFYKPIESQICISDNMYSDDDGDSAGCMIDWNCSDWSRCIDGKQSRDCSIDESSRCTKTDKPITERICDYCYNNIQDGDESGIDCGGGCKECPYDEYPRDCGMPDLWIVILAIVVSGVYLTLMNYYHRKIEITRQQLEKILVFLRAFFIVIMVLYIWIYYLILCPGYEWIKMLIIALITFFIIVSYLFYNIFKDKLKAKKVLRVVEVQESALDKWRRKIKDKARDKQKLKQTLIRRARIAEALEEKHDEEKVKLARLKSKQKESAMFRKYYEARTNLLKRFDRLLRPKKK